MVEHPRVAQVIEQIVADVRATIMDMKVTEDEIHAAARFLDQMGQAREFSDLLDILFAVTSVVATAGGTDGTTPNLAGPYYKAGAPLREDGVLYEGELPDGEIALLVRGSVTDAATGSPVSGAVLDVWQADGNGAYDVAGYHLRGLIQVADDGRYEFRTVLPEGYPIPAKGPTTKFLELMGQHNWRPAHIHLRVHVGEQTVLQTQFFIEGARFLDSDPVDAVRSDLVIPARDAEDGRGKVMDLPIRVALDGKITSRSYIDGPQVAAARS